MNRKAQTEVMVAALGMVFGLMLAPIPNLASEFVLSGIVSQMDVHAARQDAGIDAVQMTSPVGPQSKNFNPATGRINSNTRKLNTLCMSSANPGGNRSVKFAKEIEYASGQCNLVSQGTRNHRELGRPPEISFMIKDPSNLGGGNNLGRANSILLDAEVGADQSS